MADINWGLFVALEKDHDHGGRATKYNELVNDYVHKGILSYAGRGHYCITKDEERIRCPVIDGTQLSFSEEQYAWDYAKARFGERLEGFSVQRF